MNEPISYVEQVARAVAARKWPDIAAQSGIQFAAHVALVRQAVIEVLDAVKRLQDAERPLEFTSEPDWLPRDVVKAEKRLDALAPRTEIEIRQWTKRGIMFVNTFTLPGDDPDHPYNQAIAQGVRPEDYGLKRPEMPPHAVCPHCGR